MSIYKDGKLIAGGRQCMPLLSFMWADHVLNDASWLRADSFSWQNGAVYQAAYQHLADDMPPNAFWFSDGQETLQARRSSANDTINGGVNYYAWTNSTTGIVYTTSKNPSIGDNIYNASFVSSYTINSLVIVYDTETIAGTTISYYEAADGHKLVLPDQESNVMAIYNATGVAWYYIIDTTNQRFKLPRTKFGFTGIRSGVGNYVAPGLPNITAYTNSAGNSAFGTSQSGAFYRQDTNRYGIGTHNPTENENFTQNLYFDASRSSSIYGNSTTVQPPATQMYLYFYVGNFTQTALENTAGLNTELFNGKADVSTVAHVVTEFQEPTAVNNYTWYRKYADGWVEQGGIDSGSTYGSTTRQVNLPVAMADSNYCIQLTKIDIDTAGVAPQVTSAAVTNFKWSMTYNSALSRHIRWFVAGMAA